MQPMWGNKFGTIKETVSTEIKALWNIGQIIKRIILIMSKVIFPLYGFRFTRLRVWNLSWLENSSQFVVQTGGKKNKYQKSPSLSDTSKLSGISTVKVNNEAYQFLFVNKSDGEVRSCSWVHVLSSENTKSHLVNKVSLLQDFSMLGTSLYKGPYFRKPIPKVF